jgi:AraC family transcriptional regulator of arabinose operon
MADDLTFLHARHRPSCIASVDKRFDYYTLQLMTSGGIELSYDTRRYELDGAWTWPCYPGPWIRFHERPRGTAWEHRYVALSGPRVATWEADGLWPTEPQPVAPDEMDVLARLFDEVIDLSTSPGWWSRLRAVNVLERILLERAAATRPNPPAQPGWLSTVLDRLAQSGDDLDYTELARSVAMSLTTLRRRFRAATGQSLHQHRLEHRVARARQLLGTTDEPIKQIASTLGYRDVFYFTRQFTQFTGVSPALYRSSRQ